MRSRSGSASAGRNLRRRLPDRSVRMKSRQGAGMNRYDAREEDGKIFAKRMVRCRMVRRNRRDSSRPDFPRTAGRALRSEEHTSELQSLMRISYAVFCLKKKKI